MAEMKIFWILVPFLATIVVINFFFLSPFLLLATTGFVLIIGIIVFFYAASLARSNFVTRLEHDQLEGIVSSLEEAVIVYDRDFKILFFNPGAERLFLLDAKAIGGVRIVPKDAERNDRRLLAQVVYPSLAPIVVNRSPAGEYPQTTDLSFHDPLLELRVITTPLLGGGGNPLGFVKIIRDRTRDVLILKSKSEFVTIASHQLRTPLTGVNWALSMLVSDPSIGEANKEVVKNAASAGKQLLDIVEDLLMVSRIEEGRFGYRFGEVVLAEFIKNTLTLILPSAKKLGIKLYFDQPKALPPVIADAEKLKMAFENLLDNAIRYNVKNGEVVVKVEQLEGQSFILVSVKDTGIGVPPEEKEKIFTKFFRAQNALKYETEGSGLGLYIAQNVVRSHGGKIWFESEANRGTTFYFTLATDPKLVPAKEVPLEY